MYRDFPRERFRQLILNWQRISVKHNVGALYDVLFDSYKGIHCFMTPIREVLGDLELEENEGSYELM